jgi:sorting nexin-1/2
VYKFAFKFNVTKPQNTGTHVVYQINGQNDYGPFAVNKRYSDFYILRNQMLVGWQGFYVPPVPEKKTFGNTEKEFILERKEELNKFVE